MPRYKVKSKKKSDAKKIGSNKDIDITIVPESKMTRLKLRQSCASGFLPLIYRALTFEEVLAVRQNSIWRRSRLILILIFWATMAMFLSMIVCLLLKARCGPDLRAVEGVSPVHLTLAPLIASARDDTYM